MQLTEEQKGELFAHAHAMTLTQEEQGNSFIAIRNKMLPFAEHLNRDSETGETSYKANWHHKFMCGKLDAFVAGKIPRLMIFMPPQHGKSELVSRLLPAFIFGHRPDDSIISASYAADLASRMNRDTQRYIDSDQYRHLFPDVGLSDRNIRTTSQYMHLRNSDIFEIVGYKGSYRSAGVGGGITGMGANWLIIDDPIKNAEEAASPTYREKAWEWYVTTLLTRLRKPGGILLTTTRWHEDDLAGRLLALAAKDTGADQWEVISFAGIKDADNPDDPRKLGEALWPSFLDANDLEQRKATMGPLAFESLYQQRPSRREGNMFQADWIRYKKDFDIRDIEKIVVAVDPAVTATAKSDETGICVAGLTKWGDVIVIESIGLTVSPENWAQAVNALYDKYEANMILAERNQGGDMVKETLKRVNPNLPIHAIHAKKGKALRAEPVAVLYEAGKVYHVDKFFELESQMLGFPNAKHDDRLDAMVYAVSYLTSGVNDSIGNIDLGGITGLSAPSGWSLS